jgi:hypothetical protein
MAFRSTAAQRRSRMPLADRAERLNTRGMQIIDIHMSVKRAVDDAIARAVAIGGLIAVALIHILQLPTAFGDAGYLGGLFIAAVVACLALAAVLTRTSDDRAWFAAAGFTALILLGYVISRSVGLPGFTDDVGVWSEPPGLASMVAEGLTIFVTAAVLATRHYPVRRAAAASGTEGAAMRPGPVQA